MPESTFKSSGKGGTHTKTCLLVFEKHGASGAAATPYLLPRLSGADMIRGVGQSRRTTYRKSLRITRRLVEGPMKLGYAIDGVALESNILAPRYHEPEAQRATEHLIASHEPVSVAELLEEGALRISTENEIGKLESRFGNSRYLQSRHPGEGRDPCLPWVPAFAGMTRKGNNDPDQTNFRTTTLEPYACCCARRHAARQSSNLP